MLPTEYIKPFLYAMSCLVSEYGCTILLCSATQPDYHVYFNEYGISPHEIMTGIPATYEFFRRTSFKNDGECTYESIAAKMSAEKQTLCITVTKSGALSVYDGLDDNDERIYLSTSLYPLHRKKILQDIRRRLDGRMPCKVAATSVISVGVDIDFPSGYVELTGIDFTPYLADAEMEIEKKNREEFAYIKLHLYFKKAADVELVLKDETNVDDAPYIRIPSFKGHRFAKELVSMKFTGHYITVKTGGLTESRHIDIYTCNEGQGDGREYY